jgi:hypothetical protein
MQLFRQTIFVKFFAVFYAARFLLGVLDDKGAVRKACALIILAIQNYAVIGICLALLMASRAKRVWSWGAALWAAGVVTGLTAAASINPTLPMFWHSFGFSTRGLGIGLATLLVFSLATWRLPRSVPAALIATFLVIRLSAGLPFFAYDHEPPDEWYAFCQQIKRSTPREAVFITPPFLEGFQLYAERAQVADFKCFPFGETEMQEWKRRMNDLSGHSDLRCAGFVECASLLAYGYSRLREADFLHLARKYGAEYVVTAQRDQHLHFPELLRQGNFVLYRLPSVETGRESRTGASAR